jgi:hypothetical protein
MHHPQNSIDELTKENLVEFKDQLNTSERFTKSNFPSMNI